MMNQEHLFLPRSYVHEYSKTLFLTNILPPGLIQQTKKKKALYIRISIYIYI